jgi:hypothetical protein
MRTDALHSLVLIACAWLAACSEPAPEPSARSIDKPGTSEPFKWRIGSGNTQVFDSKSKALRCWPIDKAHDCLSVTVHVTADDGEVRNYSRFLATALPEDEIDLERIFVSDGYECDVRGRVGSRRLIEFFWRGGAVVDRKHSREGSDQVAWQPSELMERFAQKPTSQVRLFVPCLLIDALVQRDGLQGIDSPLLTHAVLGGGSDRREQPVIR